MVKATEYTPTSRTFNRKKGKIHNPEYGPKQETRMIRKYSGLELLELQTFKQATKELVRVWLVRLWVTGVDVLSLRQEH